MRTLPVYLRLFAVAVPFNLLWEMTQASLYAPMGTFWQATWRCFGASLGDAAMIVSIAVIGAALFGTSRWFARLTVPRLLFAALAALTVAIAVERWGLRTGRWKYNEHMPLVPGTRFGVVPLAQMVLLTPVTLWIANLRHSHTPDQT